MLSHKKKKKKTFPDSSLLLPTSLSNPCGDKHAASMHTSVLSIFNRDGDQCTAGKEDPNVAQRGLKQSSSEFFTYSFQ